MSIVLAASRACLRIASEPGPSRTSLLLVLLVASVRASESALEPARVRGALEQVGTLAPGNPWPVELAGPMLFVDPSSRRVLASHPDEGGVLRPEGELFGGTLPADVLVANTALEWGGRRWTMLRWPLPEGRFERGVLLGHELFHRVAPSLGLAMDSPANAHLDTGVGRLWMRLELRALTSALAHEGVDRRGALADALAFRARRHALFPGAGEEERALERNEGLAEYTGVRASLPPGARVGWAAGRIEEREVQAAHGDLARSFAYATGLAYGLLLDAVAPDWTSTLEPHADLAALAAAGHALEPRADEADERMRRYDGARLRAAESRRDTERASRTAAFRARFVDGPVLTLPVDESFGYSFDPNRVVPLAGEGEVHPAASVRAGWGRLEVDAGVLLRRSGASITGVVVPGPEDPRARPLAGDGWVLELADGWQLAPGARPGDWIVERGPASGEAR